MLSTCAEWIKGRVFLYARPYTGCSTVSQWRYVGRDWGTVTVPLHYTKIWGQRNVVNITYTARKRIKNKKIPRKFLSTVQHTAFGKICIFWLLLLTQTVLYKNLAASAQVQNICTACVCLGSGGTESMFVTFSILFIQAIFSM